MEMILKKQRIGLTLIEIMVAIVVVVVAVIGAMSFRYYCAVDARKADVHMTAARIGWMLLEDWKGTGGRLPGHAAGSYDPLAAFDSTELPITSAVGPATPSGFAALGSYMVTANYVNYYATLTYKVKTASDPAVLNVCVAWGRPYNVDTLPTEYRSVKLTTYSNN